MKKIIALITFFVILSSSNVYAQGGTESSYRCDGNNCITCQQGEAGCNPGVCTAFRCESSDETAPIAPIITNQDELKIPSNGRGIRVRGYGEPNTRVFISIDGKVLNESSVNGQGIFDISFDPNITISGEYKVQASLKDNQGNESNKSATAIYVVDAKKPEIQLIEVPDFSSFKTILLTGNTKPDSKVQLIKDNKITYQTGSDANGNFDVLAELSEGDNNLIIKVIDPIKNESTKDVKVKYDTTESINIDIITNTSDKVELSGPDEIVQIEVYSSMSLISRLAKNNQGKFVFDITPEVANKLSAELQFFGVDRAGNKTEPVSITRTNYTPFVIAIIFIVLVGVIGFMIYTLVKQGKLKLPMISKPKVSPDQTVIPVKLKKEY